MEGKRARLSRGEMKHEDEDGSSRKQTCLRIGCSVSTVNGLETQGRQSIAAVCSGIFCGSVLGPAVAMRVEMGRCRFGSRWPRHSSPVTEDEGPFRYP